VFYHSKSDVLSADPSGSIKGCIMHLWQNVLNAHEKREGRELSKQFSNGYAMRFVHVGNSFANLRGQWLCRAVHGMQVLTLALHECMRLLLRCSMVRVRSATRGYCKRTWSDGQLEIDRARSITSGVGEPGTGFDPIGSRSVKHVP